MTVGSTLRSLRRRAGLSQVDLARRAGIPATVLSAYEHDRRQPGADIYFKLVRAAGFEPRYVPLLDDREQGRRLADVLTLAAALPHRPRSMPRARRRAS